MKKKTSLWISGITTAALLVTAVGSFAAWKITSDTTTGLEVTAADSVAIEVAEESIIDSGKTLVPKDVAITGTEANSIKGKFKASLKAGAADNYVVPTVTKLQVSGDTDNTTDSALKCTFYSDEACNTPITDFKTHSNDQYYFKVEFANADGDSFWTADNVAKYAGKTIDLEITCTATPTTPVS